MTGTPPRVILESGQQSPRGAPDKNNVDDTPNLAPLHPRGSTSFPPATQYTVSNVLL